MNKVLLVVALVLGGCAGNPDKMNAQYVSPLQYQANDCSELSTDYPQGE